MSYIVLARKYRPAKFSEVIGQEHITGLLQKSVQSGRIAQAYLFCGPRGVGKTSCARILAKSLNCQNGPTVDPCGTCGTCKEIAAGSSFDVLEIDGASNRGIDEIRTLRENVKFAPGFGRYKIYIVDEVHMLTMEAFNALLKTLEEPPEHVKFILATTDPNKVPATILSRCQRFDFRRLPSKTIAETLKNLSGQEKLDLEQDALFAIAKSSQGSLRDALSILDQLSALSGRAITGQDVYSMLGLVEMDLVFELAGHLARGNCAEALKTLDGILEKGKDIRQLTKDLTEHFRNLMVIKIGGKTLGRLVDYPIHVKDQYLEQSREMDLAFILKGIDILIEAQETGRVTESLRTALEIAIAKLTCGAGTGPAADRNTAPAEPVRQAAPAPRRTSPAQMIKNNKGAVDLRPAPQRDEPAGDMPDNALEEAARENPAEEEEEAATALPPEESGVDLSEPVAGPFEISHVKRVWDTLTYAVSREKMSLATYLQEGFPYAVKDDCLVVGFTAEHAFHKDSLDHNEYKIIIDRIFSEKLNRQITVKFVVTDGNKDAAPKDEPLLQSALETFSGKIVSEWHKE